VKSGPTYVFKNNKNPRAVFCEPVIYLSYCLTYTFGHPIIGLFVIVNFVIVNSLRKISRIGVTIYLNLFRFIWIHLDLLCLYLVLFFCVCAFVTFINKYCVNLLCVTRCQLLRLKHIKFAFRWGCTPAQRSSIRNFDVVGQKRRWTCVRVWPWCPYVSVDIRYLFSMSK